MLAKILLFLISFRKTICLLLLLLPLTLPAQQSEQLKKPVQGKDSVSEEREEAREREISAEEDPMAQRHVTGHGPTIAFIEMKQCALYGAEPVSSNFSDPI